MQVPNQDAAVREAFNCVKAATSIPLPLKRLDSNVSPLTLCGWSDAGRRGLDDAASFYLGPALLFDALSTSAVLDWNWHRPSVRCWWSRTRAVLSVSARDNIESIRINQLKDSAIWRMCTTLSTSSAFTVVLRVSTITKPTAATHLRKTAQTEPLFVATQGHLGSMQAVQTLISQTELFVFRVVVDVWRHHRPPPSTTTSIDTASLAASISTQSAATATAPTPTFLASAVPPAVPAPPSAARHMSAATKTVSEEPTSSLGCRYDPLLHDGDVASASPADINLESSSVLGSVDLDGILSSPPAMSEMWRDGEETLSSPDFSFTTPQWEVSSTSSFPPLGSASFTSLISPFPSSAVAAAASSHSVLATNFRHRSVDIGWWLPCQQRHLFQMLFNWQQLNISPHVVLHAETGSEEHGAWTRGVQFVHLLSRMSTHCAPCQEANLHYFSVCPKGFSFNVFPLIVAPVGADRQLLALCSLAEVAPQPMWCQLHFLKPLTSTRDASQAAQLLQRVDVLTALASSTRTPIAHVDWWRVKKETWQTTRILRLSQSEFMLRLLYAMQSKLSVVRHRAAAGFSSLSAVNGHNKYVQKVMLEAWAETKREYVDILWGDRSTTSVSGARNSFLWSTLERMMTVNLLNMLEMLCMDADHVVSLLELPVAINPFVLGHNSGVVVQTAQHSPLANKLWTCHQVASQILTVQFLVRVVVWVVQRALERLLGPSVWSSAVVHVTLVHRDDLCSHGMDALVMDARVHPSRPDETSLHVSVFLPALFRCNNWYEMHKFTKTMEKNVMVVGSPLVFFMIPSCLKRLSEMVERLAQRVTTDVVQQFVHLLHTRGGTKGGREHLLIPLMREVHTSQMFVTALVTTFTQLCEKNVPDKIWGTKSLFHHTGSRKDPTLPVCMISRARYLMCMLSSLGTKEGTRAAMSRDRLTMEAIRMSIQSMELRRRRSPLPPPTVGVVANYVQVNMMM